MTGHRDTELTKPLYGGLAPEGQVRAAVVIFVFPGPALLGELLRGTEGYPPVEFVRVGPKAPFHLPVGLGSPPRDPTVHDPEIMQVPGEVGSELGPMIGLDALDGDRESPPHFLEERDGRFGRVVLVV